MKTKTNQIVTLLILLFLFITLLSCGKDQDNIFGEYQLSRWELTSCRLVDNDQVATLSGNEICIQWSNGSQTCVVNTISILQDSTFIYDFKSEEYDAQGNQTDSSNNSSSGTYSVIGDELALKDEDVVLRRYTLDDISERFTRSTKSITICDTREFFYKK